MPETFHIATLCLLLRDGIFLKICFLVGWHLIGDLLHCCSGLFVSRLKFWQLLILNPQLHNAWNISPIFLVASIGIDILEFSGIFCTSFCIAYKVTFFLTLFLSHIKDERRDPVPSPSPSSHPIILLHHKKGRSNIRNQFSQTILLISVGKYRCTFDVWNVSGHFSKCLSLPFLVLSESFRSVLPFPFPCNLCVWQNLFCSQLIENISWKPKENISWKQRESISKKTFLNNKRKYILKTQEKIYLKEKIWLENQEKVYLKRGSKYF